MKLFNWLFTRKKLSSKIKNEVTNKKPLIVQIDPKNYQGLSNREMIKKACLEYDAYSTPFTSKMIYTYLGGLVSPENTYKQVHALYKLGFLHKKTVLCSNPEMNKHKHFYELNKNINYGK